MTNGGNRRYSFDWIQQSDLYEDATGLVLIPKTFPELLAYRSFTSPHRLALDSYIRQWTWAQLERDVGFVAEGLRRQGVGPAQNVGLCFDLSPWAVVALLASMTVGAAVVPICPDHPKPRRITTLREANVSFVIVEDHECGKDLEDSGYAIIRLMEINFDPVSQTTIISVSKPVDPAFISFTSGTTGVPKGIVQTHEAIVTMCAALAACLGLEESSRVSQLHPYMFDVAVMEIGMCLATGAAICLTQKGDMMLPSAGELGPELTRSRITHTTISPTMLNMMDPVEVPTLRVLSVMGEPLGRDAVRKWATCPSRTFFQLWGTTEGCILQTITTPIAQDQDPQNIGMALPGACRIWITDPDCTDTLLEDGKVGEIVIESRALATGYIGRSEETKNSFLDRAQWQDSNSCGRVYRSGDLGRKDAAGMVTFAGRRDDQMNFHGERLELGEIDHHLTRCRPAEILDCFAEFDEARQVVIGFMSSSRVSRNHVERHDLILAWPEATPITKHAMAQFTEDLFSDPGGELLAHMIPRYWVPIRARPLTASGKTDRSLLRRLVREMSMAQWKEFEVRPPTEMPLYHY